MAKRGPKTPEGRAAVRRNAWKHGIRSDVMSVPEWEDPAEWEAHHRDTIESLESEGHLEHMLAERVAICLWKLRRLEFVHMGELVTNLGGAYSHLLLLKALRRGEEPPDDEPEVHPVDLDLEQSRRLLPNSLVLPNLTRYEAHLHRICVQTLHELEALQARRRGQATPLARFDISRSPSDAV